jgi:hypothetical protein
LALKYGKNKRIMSIRDKEIYTEFCKLDFRLKGAKSSQPNDSLKSDYDALMEAHKKLMEAKKELSDADLAPRRQSIKSSAVIAHRLGVSPKIIENCRYIRDHGSEDIKNRVETGSLSISQAVKLTKPYHDYKKRQLKPSGRPRTKPGVAMSVIFTKTFEYLTSGESYTKKRYQEAFRLLVDNLAREGWMSKEEAEDIHRMLNS